MENHGVSINKHCTCTQAECPILGNCVLCVQNHLEHKRHIPECIQDLLRPAIQGLAQQMELKTADSRPAPSYWNTVDKQTSLKNSLGRHADRKDD